MPTKRNTKQKTAVLETLQQAERPLSLPEILSRAKKTAPSIGQATIYRTLKELNLSGQLSAVQLAGQPTRYEPANRAHHHHFHCHACGKVYDLPGCLPRLVSLLPRGFKMESHDVTLHGRCRNCTKKQSGVPN